MLHSFQHIQTKIHFLSFSIQVWQAIADQINGHHGRNRAALACKERVRAVKVQVMTHVAEGAPEGGPPPILTEKIFKIFGDEFHIQSQQGI